jgi:response regulator RpfG family c-di-GMP phosphodiesterase
MNALVVTNQEELYRRFSGLLREIAIHAEPESDPVDAKDVLENKPYDIVVLDCDLESSTDVIESMRKTGPNQRTFLFGFVSGYNKQTAITRSGANLVMLKPINWQMAKRNLRTAQAIVIRERRNEIRAKAKTIVQLSFVTQRLEVMLNDLSETGMAVTSRHPLKKGEQVHIRFSLPGSTIVIRGKGHIAWSKSDGTMGIAFDSLNDADRDLICKWVMLRYPRKSPIV